MRNRRDQVIGTIVKRYRSHPTVEQAIQNQKTSHYTPRVGDNLNIHDFLAEAGTYALLSKEDEQELFGYIEEGYNLYEAIGGLAELTPGQEEVLVRMTAAQQVIYHTNLRLAFSIAKKYLKFNSGGLTSMDHIQEAIAGLSLAINRFDKDKGFKYSTYATMWVRQSITAAIGNKSRTIRIPMHKHEKYINIKMKVNKFADNLGRYLTPEEIEYASGMSYKDYTELMRVGAPYSYSLDDILPNTDDQEYSSLIGHNPFDEIIRNTEIQEEAAETLASVKLTDREKFVLGLRFGFSPDTIGDISTYSKSRTVTYADAFTGDAMTLEELGEVLGLTRERVRQIESKALGLIRVKNGQPRKLKAREQR